MRLVDTSTARNDLSNGDTVDVSRDKNGGITPYSAATVSLSTSITAFNDAPVASGSATLAAVDEDSPSPVGETVDNLFKNNFDDSKDAVTNGSRANTLKGVVITGNAANASTQGKWQYSVDDGTNWVDMSTSLSDSSALYLAAATKLRFKPVGDFNGTPGGLTVRLVDTSTARNDLSNGDTVDVSGAKNGGITPYSATTVSLSTSITAFNDAPVLADNIVLAYTENGAPTPINTAITVTDVDTTLSSATVSITNGFVSNEDVLSFTNVLSTMGNITGSYNPTTGVMTLTSAARSATLTQWQAALRAVSYSNNSDNPSTAARTINFLVNDGQGANSISNTVTSTVNVTAVNDAPLLAQPSPIAMPRTGGTTYANKVGAMVASDPDSTVLTYSITNGATGGNFQTGGITYDISRQGTYGTLYLKSSTGEYVYVPNATAINAVNASQNESFTLTVSDNGSPSVDASIKLSQLSR